MTIKEEYNQILKSGMFYELFPTITANWGDDKEYFEAFVINRDKKNTH